MNKVIKFIAVFSLLLICFFGCSLKSGYVEKIKSPVVFTKNNAGMVLELKPLDKSKIKNRLDEGEFTLIDDNVHKFNFYSKKQKIKVLEELLMFQGDTTKSAQVYFYRESPKLKNYKKSGYFTVQIEALYTFTNLLMNRDTDIKPELVFRANGRMLKHNQKEIDAVYSIFHEWLKKNKTAKFKDFDYPLVYSPYGWEGDKVIDRSYLKTSL